MMTDKQIEEIARTDAGKKYRDLSIYDVQMRQKEDKSWEVEFKLKDPSKLGGGPHYVIDCTGKIVSAKYFQ